MSTFCLRILPARKNATLRILFLSKPVDMNASPVESISMEWEFGRLRSNQAWVAWAMLATGVSALPLSWLLRDSLAIGRAPLPSWTVLMVGVLLTIVFIIGSLALIGARTRPPKLITIRGGKLTIPGGLLIGRGWSLPIADVKIRIYDIGFVKQILLSGKGKRATLSSTLFVNDEEFERLVDTLSRQ